MKPKYKYVVGMRYLSKTCLGRKVVEARWYSMSPEGTGKFFNSLPKAIKFAKNYTKAHYLKNNVRQPLVCEYRPGRRDKSGTIIYKGDIIYPRTAPVLKAVRIEHRYMNEQLSYMTIFVPPTTDIHNLNLRWPRKENIVAIVPLTDYFEKATLT